MKIPFDKKSKIAILGFGVEGKSVHKFLKKHGYIDLTIIDEKLTKKGVINSLKTLHKFEIIFRSPGIHKDHPQLKKARNKGAIITSATQLFFDLCPCKIIGITGTKGKGTTSTLIYEILKEAGKHVYLGGNIGRSPLEFLHLLKKNSYAVMELSSFQLHDLNKSPHIAVVLKTTSEHLDYHKDIDEYQDAKSSIVRYQTPKDYVIVNKDFQYYKRYLNLSTAKALILSKNKHAKNGAYITKNQIVSTINCKKNVYCRTDEVGLAGPHNLENIMAAVAACHALKIPKSKITKIVKNFKGLPHRIELIRKYKGIEFYNDSFSTTPETCIAAINSFNCPIVLIAGGSEKHSDFTELGKEIGNQKNLKKVILMGKTAKRIADTIKKPKDIYFAKTYQEAFNESLARAKKGWVVVLSPASASFDMFKNYKHRGDTFRKWVESL